MPDRVVQLLGPSAGGIRRHVACLTAELEARGWTAVVAGPAGVMEGVGRQDAVVPVPRGVSPSRVVGSARRVAELSRGADLVHAHGLTPGWIAALARHRPPLVVTIHNLVLDEVHGWRAPALRVIETILPRRVESLIAVSRGVADRLGSAAVTAVIPPAGPAPVVDIGPEDVRRQLGIPLDAPLVVTVGRLGPQKDIPTFLRAVARAADTVPDLRAVVAGEGRDRDALERLASDLGLMASVRVTFAGPVVNAANLMAAADVVVVSSLWESGPLVLFEAMLLGRPVVTTRVGIADDLVHPGMTGHLVPVGDHEAIAAGIVAVVTDRDRAAAMAGRGREIAERLVGSGALVSAVEDVYRATLNR